MIYSISSIDVKHRIATVRQFVKFIVRKLKLFEFVCKVVTFTDSVQIEGHIVVALLRHNQLHVIITVRASLNAAPNQ